MQIAGEISLYNLISLLNLVAQLSYSQLLVQYVNTETTDWLSDQYKHLPPVTSCLQNKVRFPHIILV